MFDLKEKDLVLLSLYRTQAIVGPAWPDKSITQSRISDDERRTALFEELLENSSNLLQFQALGKLLSIWPQLQDAQSE